jgi:DUF4097 and DUF4098 domain-containing protein YvlB
MKRILVIATYALLLLLGTVATFSLMTLTASSAYAADTGSSINETRTAKADGTIWVHNLAGSVKIRGWDKDEVRVTGTLGAGSKRLDITDDDGGIDIRVVLPEHSNRNVEGSDLIIDVPKASRITVGTVSADIEASQVNGTANLKSVSGDVKLDSLDSDIAASSVSGNVDIVGSAPNAHINAHGISNEVRVSGVDGDLQAESISGTVKVFGKNRLSRAQLSSTSGNVEFTAELTRGGSYTFNSTSGNVEVSFPKTPDARFDISTFSGNIDNSFGPKPQRISEYGPGEELHFTSGTGSAQVNARTLSGNINLRTQ